ncbi:MAG: DUF4252 domain-containing protein [Pyrinomonadaceae bacterium]
MLTFALLLLLIICSASLAQAQDAKLRIEALSALEQKSVKTIDVSVDGALLQLAAKFLSSAEPDEARVKELISGLKGVYVKRYEFERAGEYAQSDVASVQSQLTNSAWTKMVTVRSKSPETENVDVYTMLQGGKINGMAVIVAEAKALTVVNIVGLIDIEKLVSLEGQMGIPKLNIDFSNGEEKPKP